MSISPRAKTSSGGLVTNSPPATVRKDRRRKRRRGPVSAAEGLPHQEWEEYEGEPVALADDEPGRVLSCNVDSLVLSVQVDWKSKKLHELLKHAKAQAKEKHADEPIVVKGFTGEDWSCNVAPHGASGYEWIMSSREMTWKVGSWVEMMARPSMMVEFRSEWLWSTGLEKAIERVHRLLTYWNAEVVSMTPSRLDLCADVLLRDDDFRQSAIADGIVCQARKRDFIYDGRTMETVWVGRGAVSCRLYDKVREIRQVSAKWWMFNFWGFKPEQLTDDYRVVRVEFQFRRESLSELGLNDCIDLIDQRANVWAYCTRKWFRLVDDNRKHTVRQKLLPWWGVVQQEWKATEADPAVRAKAVKAKESQILAQLFGQWISLLALDDEQAIESVDPISIKDHVSALVDRAEAMGLDGGSLRERVRERVAKYQKRQRTHNERLRERRAIRKLNPWYQGVRVKLALRGGWLERERKRREKMQAVDVPATPKRAIPEPPAENPPPSPKQVQLSLGEWLGRRLTGGK